MIYNEYKVKFFSDNKSVPVRDYIDKLPLKDKAKVLKYIEFLREKGGYLEEPYSKHIKGKIRELRIDFGRNKHRIFYFCFINKNIILLHAFLKKSRKIPRREMERAISNYKKVRSYPKYYE